MNTADAGADDGFLLIGCGILARELHLLIERRGWPMDTLFLDSALHIDMERLAGCLEEALSAHGTERTVVFYGACHPLMDRILSGAGTLRTEGQNCAAMLPGDDLFLEELSRGAFFLMEDWARRWEETVVRTFGGNLKVAREIFQGDRKYILCLRTPCSGDFTEQAEAAGRMVGLPLRWMDVTLDRLASVLDGAMERRRAGSPCRK
jgi:hypothetical protein